MNTLRELTRRFVREQLQPMEQTVETEDHIPSETWDDLVRAAIDMGIYTANIPEELGGTGLSVPQQCLLWEEFGHTSWPLTYLVCRPNSILIHCSPDQRSDYLQPALTGERTQSFALTEPEAGSDIRGIKTTARRSGGDFVINGTKHFISNAHCDFAIVIARHEDGDNGDTKGSSANWIALLVDQGTEGFEVGRRQEMMGFRGMGQFEVAFRDCVVPASNVIGSPGAGLDIAKAFLVQSRLAIAAYSVGSAERAIRDAIAYAKQRTVSGSKLIDKQGIRWKIADMSAAHFSARATMREAARRYDNALESSGSDVVAERETRAVVSIAKLETTRTLNQVVDTALQIHGGVGWTKDLPIERLYRDSRVFRIVDGPDEVHQEVIGKAASSVPADAPFDRAL